MSNIEFLYLFVSAKTLKHFFQCLSNNFPRNEADRLPPEGLSALSLDNLAVVKNELGSSLSVTRTDN
jgi:hypothetical protein